MNKSLVNVTNVEKTNDFFEGDCGVSFNDTVSYCTSDSYWGISRVQGINGMVTSTVAFLIFSVEIVTLYETAKMRRLPFATRFLFCLNLFLQCCFILIIVVAAPLRLIIGENTTMAAIAKEIGELAMTGSWTCMGLLSLERLFCISKPNEYIRIVSKRRAVCVCLSCITVVWTAKLFTKYFIMQHLLKVPGNTHNADILTSILGICISICLICNVHILKITNYQKRLLMQQLANTVADVKSNNTFHSFRSTHVVWVLIIFFVSLYLPWLAIKVIRTITKSDFLRSTEFIFNMLNCCADPFVYAWRLTECRYHILALFGKCSPRISAYVERMRINIFNIPVREFSATKTLTVTTCKEEITVSNTPRSTFCARES